SLFRNGKGSVELDVDLGQGHEGHGDFHGAGGLLERDFGIVGVQKLAQVHDLALELFAAGDLHVTADVAPPVGEGLEGTVEAGGGHFDHIGLVAEPVLGVEHRGDLAAHARAVVHADAGGLAHVDAHHAAASGAEELDVDEFEAVRGGHAPGECGDLIEYVHRVFHHGVPRVARHPALSVPG